MSSPRGNMRRRRDDDYDFEDQDDYADESEMDDEDELTDDEARLGLKVVELGPRGLRPLPGLDARRRPDGRIFHEFDQRHPGGEALVVKGRRVKVYPTSRVQEALGSRLLVETTKPPTPEPPNMADLLDVQRHQAAMVEAHVQAQVNARLAEASLPAATPVAPATPAAQPEEPQQPEPQRKPGSSTGSSKPMGGQRR